MSSNVLDMENTTATDTTYLDQIAAAITPEWVAELSDDQLVMAASDDTSDSGIWVEVRSGRPHLVSEFEHGETAVLWIGDDGKLIVWGGRPVDDDADGPWVYGDTVVIDPAALAAVLEAAA